MDSARRKDEMKRWQGHNSAEADFIRATPQGFTPYANEIIDNHGTVLPETARRIIDAVESANTTQAIYEAWEDAIAAGLAEWKAGNYSWHRRVFRLIGAQAPPQDLSQIGLNKPLGPTIVSGSDS